MLLFEHFPRLSPSIRVAAYRAVNRLFAIIAQRGGLLKTFVSSIGTHSACIVVYAVL